MRVCGVLGSDKPTKKRDASIMALGLSGTIMQDENTLSNLEVWKSLFEKCVLLADTNTLAQEIDEEALEDIFEHQGYAKLMAIQEVSMGSDVVIDDVKKKVYQNVMQVWTRV